MDSDDLLVGLAPADDAAVYRLDDDRAIIFTLDFFPPIVDDPADFGAIAATNALNDVFAMGGTPILALSIARPSQVSRPRCSVRSSPRRTSRCAPPGRCSPAAHDRDEEPKYGLAVVGTVRPDALWPKNGAKPGDSIFLTKPLGTGLIMTGFQQGAAGTQPLERAVRWMRTLNMDAASVLRQFEPNAVTDVTGFGLFGHAQEVAERSGADPAGGRSDSPRSTGRSTWRATEFARAGIRATGSSQARISR